LPRILCDGLFHALYKCLHGVAHRHRILVLSSFWFITVRICANSVCSRLFVVRVSSLRGSLFMFWTLWYRAVIVFTAHISIRFMKLCVTLFRQQIIGSLILRHICSTAGVIAPDTPRRAQVCHFWEIYYSVCWVLCSIPVVHVIRFMTQYWRSDIFDRNSLVSYVSVHESGIFLIFMCSLHICILILQVTVYVRCSAVSTCDVFGLLHVQAVCTVSILSLLALPDKHTTCFKHFNESLDDDVIQVCS
jgi:hypothetical protein